METSNPGSPTRSPDAPPARRTGAARAPAAEVGGAAAEDDQTIDQALAGDSAAFGRLVEKYQDRLYNSLLRYTGSSEDAQDIAQDAFVQAFVKLSSFKRNSAFFTWLYRIGFNRAASNARKRRERTSFDQLSEAGAPDPTDHQAPPEAAMLAQERVELVRQAVAELADDHRQVVVLREFDGFDYQQISEVLEIPIGTVRSRLFRARMQMKERLAAIVDEAQEALQKPDLGAQH
ncbi:ECF RNA polymerase sigma factor SigW [Posidoniimonas polymericola]|uniref:RNA polymerase sigma factor n=1 Tax=Posidoniimonas polymericola TaxID=2528002 RepID=A0A5C5YRM1_9BACT|nr:sigma-70 family RNA polymerase sigma factor [Posidoniimonas polymericola]TWT77614.1 ECF RNA polymerase sigma factor SigW [Posidoniimonas polymericola]